MIKYVQTHFNHDNFAIYIYLRNEFDSMNRPNIEFIAYIQCTNDSERNAYFPLLI